jgi:hypothetical protein
MRAVVADVDKSLVADRFASALGILKNAVRLGTGKAIH